MNMNKRATIKQVAKAAGVSTQTVSRVINDRPDVSSETRERIQQIILEMDYRPSELARSLIQQRSFYPGSGHGRIEIFWPITNLERDHQHGRGIEVRTSVGRTPPF